MQMVGESLTAISIGILIVCGIVNLIARERKIHKTRKLHASVKCDPTIDAALAEISRRKSHAADNPFEAEYAGQHNYLQRR